MLHEENILHVIDAIQIYTCHRYISICFKTWELLLQFYEQEHTLLPDVLVEFIPDYYDRTRISIENLPIELPDEDVQELLSTYATPIGKLITLEKDTKRNIIQLERQSTNVYT